MTDKLWFRQVCIFSGTFSYTHPGCSVSIMLVLYLSSLPITIYYVVYHHFTAVTRVPPSGQPANLTCRTIPTGNRGKKDCQMFKCV